MSLVFRSKIDQQTGKAMNLNARNIREHRTGHVHPLLHGKERGFIAVLGNGHDDFVEQSRRAAHDILVSTGNGVERARINGFQQFRLFSKVRNGTGRLFPLGG